MTTRQTSGQKLQATSVQQSGDMIEDYNQTLLPPIGDDIADSFIALQNGAAANPATELITVSQSNDLMWFYPDSGSGSGWTQQDVSVDGAPSQTAINKVLAFYQNNDLYAFAHYASDTTAGSDQLCCMKYSSKNSGRWDAVLFDDPDLSNALSQMTQTDIFIDTDGTVYLYGISVAFNPPVFSIIGIPPGKSKFQILYQETINNDAATTSYKLLPGSDSGGFVILKLDGKKTLFRGAAYKGGQISLTGSSSQPDLGLGALSADRVIPVPRGTTSPAFLLLASNRQLYQIVGTGLDGGSAPAVTELTGGTDQPTGLVAAQGGTGGDGAFGVFVLDTDSKLWIARQQNTSATGSTPSFVWAPLGNMATALGVPATTAASPEVFIYGIDNTITHLGQTSTTDSWFLNTVATPSPSSQPLASATSYTQEFTAIDDNGNPVPGSVVDVFVDVPQVLVINGVAQHVLPTVPTPAQADVYGRVTVAAAATALASPAISVNLSGSTAGASAPTSYRADLLMHQRLAGQDPTFTVDGDSLKTAGLLPDSVSSDDADKLAGTLKGLGTTAVSLAQPTTASTAAAAVLPGVRMCIEIDYRTPGQMTCRELREHEITALHTMAVESFFGDIWGDIANFFKNAWDDIKKITVHIVDSVANFFIHLADEVKQFTLNTIDDVRDGIEVLLQSVNNLWHKAIDAIKTAIDWLKALFDWDDIINTKEVIKHYVQGMVSNLQNDLSSLQTAFDSQFESLEDKVNDAFDNLESVFSSKTSFNGAGPTPSNPPPPVQGGPPLTGTNLSQQASTHAARTNYVTSKWSSSSSTTTMMLASSQGRLTTTSDPLTVIEKAFSDQFSQDDFKTAANKISQVIGPSDIKSPSDFLNVIIVDLLEATKDLVLLAAKGIKAVVDAIFQFASDALATFLDVLDKEIDIPVISALYKKISGDPLTLLDLMCLIVAVPATILYKIFYGGSSASPPFTDDQVQKILSEKVPAPWSSLISGSSAAPKFSEDTPPASGVELLKVLAVISGFFYCAFDIAGDVLNASNIEDPDGISASEMTLITWPIITIGAFSLAASGIALVAERPNPTTEADWFAVTNWAAGLVPWAADIVMTCRTDSNRTVPKGLMRFARAEEIEYGSLVDGALGGAQLALGLCTASEMVEDPSNYDGWDEASAVMSGFSNLGKFFTYLPVFFPDYGLFVAIGFMCVFNFADDIGDSLADLIG